MTMNDHLKHGMLMSGSVRAAVALLLLGSLQGCSGNHEELRTWMDQQRQVIKPSVKPIAEPKQFVPANYEGRQATLDPFDAKKLTRVLQQSKSTPTSVLFDAEQDRRKQPLEAYALDTMHMVGTLKRNGRLVGLVKVDNLLYQVVPGNYLGQNFGLVKTVDDRQIVLREIVQDAAGEWIERAASLEIQEK